MARHRKLWKRRVAALFPVLIAFGATLPQPGVVASAASKQPSYPNVLVIMTDDQRAGVGQMPVTRRKLIRKGVRFTNAFATTPSCCPSRASIFSGLYSHNHGVTNNAKAESLDQSETLQRWLQDGGYTTGIFGKFLNSWRTHPPYFDHYAVLSGPPKRTYYGGRWLTPSGRREIAEYSTDYIAKRGTSFIKARERRDRQPWLLYLTPHAPHLPFRAEPQYENDPVSDWPGNPAVFEEDRRDKPGYVRAGVADYEHGSYLRTRQMRTLFSVDDLVGAVLRQLDELGEARNTIVVFMSDNGFLWGEHGILKKQVPYLQATNIPLAIRWPAVIEPGIDTRLVANIDIAPTILDATNVLRPDEVELDGKSLLDPSWDRDRLLLEFEYDAISTIPSWASTVTRDHQYTEYYDDLTETVTFREYYDLSEDPWQLVNLYGDDDHRNDPAWLDMSGRLQADRNCRGDDCP